MASIKCPSLAAESPFCSGIATASAFSFSKDSIRAFSLLSSFVSYRARTCTVYSPVFLSLCIYFSTTSKPESRPLDSVLTVCVICASYSLREAFASALDSTLIDTPMYCIIPAINAAVASLSAVALSFAEDDPTK